jgi:hypothetical protein
LEGFDLSPKQMQMEYEEKRLFWENMNNTVATIAENIKKDRKTKGQIDDPNYNVNHRIRHLKQPIKDFKVNSKTFIQDKGDGNRRDLVGENMPICESNNFSLDANKASFAFSHVEPSADRTICESLEAGSKTGRIG